MKELSIKEKAKRYDEAIEIAKKINNEQQAQPFNIMTRVFPELKESEDERIRKDMIEHFKRGIEVEFPELEEKYNTWISWLEKQGRHSIYNVPSREVILSIWDLGNEWKELTNGSISTEYGTQLDYIQKHWRESEYYLREKQGEQKHKDRYTFKSIPRLLDMIEPTDKAKSYCQKLIDSLLQEGYATDAKIVSDCLKQMNGENVAMAVMDIEKQGEQKHETPIPRFNIGDWVIVHNKDAYQVIGFNTYDYRLQHYLGGKMNYPFKYESDLKPWTIQDAKDGDVLSDGTTIFIFKDLLSDGSVMSYCDYDTDSGESDAFCPLSVNLMCSKITPSTKEQRDLLFQKMKEAGLEWDAEIKS